MRTGTVTSLAIVLMLAASGRAQQAAAPDRLEQLLWQGAQSANSVPGYDTYLRRYPNGAYADAARDGLAKLGVTPATAAEPPAATPQPPTQQLPPAPPPPPAAAAPLAPTPPPVAPPAAPQEEAAASPLFLCRPVFASGAAPLGQANETELAAYLDATRANSVEAYRRYLQAYPQGVFAPAIEALVKERTARAQSFAASSVPGPAAARVRRPIAPGIEDYPPEARRAGQSGVASAVWEIAEDGCVQSCRIEKSSGSPALDAATCRVATARGRYDPARDGSGKTIRSIGTATVTWSLPR